MDTSRHFDGHKYRDKYDNHILLLEAFSNKLNKELGYQGAFEGFREQMYRDAL